MPVSVPGPVVVVVGAAAVAAAAGYATLNHLRTWADGVAKANGYPDDGNGGGAFRHALVSAEITRMNGEEVAKFLGDLNEAARPENYDPSNATNRNQDLANNKAGRDIGKTSTSEQDSINKVKNATDNSVSNPNNGPLVIDHHTDPRVKPENFPSDSIPWPFPDSSSTTPPVFPIGDANRNGIPDIHESQLTPRAKAANDAAKAALPPRRDPLTLDLDNDGLETTGVAATNPILFDHDGDGIKNGTGWVSSDDGFLVRDVNGNGTIDSGRELFGDSTIKSNGQTATDGFDALADLDSNADGKISNLDAQFANLRIWRDLNQDGISQTGELFTLASLNIAAINVTSTANSQTLANGNQIADLGTFTKTEGTTGTAGAVTGNLADINLASDTFHPTFPNVLDTTSVATLPDMQACPERSRRSSGAVRDLREAANDGDLRVLA